MKNVHPNQRSNIRSIVEFSINVKFSWSAYWVIGGIREHRILFHIFFFQNLLELFFLEEENTEQSHWNCWHWGCTTIRNASGRHSTARTKQHHSLFWSMSPLVREANVLPLHFIKAYIHTCCGGEGYGWITRTDAQPPTHQWTPCVLWDGAISSFEKIQIAAFSCPKKNQIIWNLVVEYSDYRTYRRSIFFSKSQISVGGHTRGTRFSRGHVPPAPPLATPLERRRGVGITKDG